MTIDKERAIFEQFFPAESIDYCFALWKNNNFHFKITKARQTKLGDYSYDPRTGKHQVTVNYNLNKYAFLVTFIHEVAHLLVKVNVKYKHDPHGAEWKQYFRDTFKPLLNENILPKSILVQLIDYLRDPAASTGGHHGLYLALRSFDVSTGEIPLKELALNEKFSFQGRVFVRGELRRTRFVCTELPSQKQYLVPIVAMVRRVE